MCLHGRILAASACRSATCVAPRPSFFFQKKAKERLQVSLCTKMSYFPSFGHEGTAAAAGEAATEAAADTVRATLDPADGGREALHVAARKCVARGDVVAWGPVKAWLGRLPCLLSARACTVWGCADLFLISPMW